MIPSEAISTSRILQKKPLRPVRADLAFGRVAKRYYAALHRDDVQNPLSPPLSPSAVAVTQARTKKTMTVHPLPLPEVPLTLAPTAPEPVVVQVAPEAGLEVLTIPLPALDGAEKHPSPLFSSSVACSASSASFSVLSRPTLAPRVWTLVPTRYWWWGCVAGACSWAATWVLDSPVG